jgi:peptide deformylase
VYEEGCLSVPGLSWEIPRAKHVHLAGLDLDGNELSVEGEDLLARVFQHETDHLDGILLLERLDEEQRREAKRELRDRQLAATAGVPEPRRRLRLPGRS